MHIRFGYELIYATPVPTHMILMLHTQLKANQRYVIADTMQVSRAISRRSYTDGFGNTCTRLELPPGPTRITADALIEDSRPTPNPTDPTAYEHPVRKPAVRGAAVPAQQPLLRHRGADGGVALGACSVTSVRVGAGCRRSATTSTSTWSSTIGMPGRHETASETFFRASRACAGTSPHLAIALCRYAEHSRPLLHRLPGRYRGCRKAGRHPWTLPAAWRSTSPASGMSSIRETTRGGSGGSSSPAAATPATWRSAPPSVPASLQLFKVRAGAAENKVLRRAG